MALNGAAGGWGLKYALDKAALLPSATPFSVLLFGHCLSVLPLFRGFTPYWLVSLVIGFVAAFGGGTMSALMLQVRHMHHHRRLPPPASSTLC